MLERVARYEDFDFDDADEEVGRPGLIARLARRALRRPGRTGATVLMLLGGGVIVANATFFQTAEHPSPLFSTRGDEPVAVAAAPPASPAAEAAIPPVPERSPVAAEDDDITRLVRTASVDPSPVTARTVSPAVTEVQQLLTELGYSPGVVDGLFGSLTRGAIEEYQRDRDLPVTGEVDDALLASLRTAMSEDRDITAAIPDPAAIELRSVQTALNEAGYGPIRVDGEESPELAAAVRTFQLEHGLELTGRVDETLVARLVAIGAMAPR